LLLFAYSILSLRAFLFLSLRAEGVAISPHQIATAAELPRKDSMWCVAYLTLSLRAEGAAISPRQIATAAELPGKDSVRCGDCLVPPRFARG